ncbi:MAG: hypothetical protein A3G24_19195 [Betaproteobacteria bacterium RIFCSPLOWO2_12_FULL_62_13]|nr:MAG: hypothetical protein A3G24_19195 [Betaproteobacteria bacterium RIFCSPLOWO2_12_FULL_62_13]
MNSISRLSLALAASLALASGLATAQQFPTKPVRFVVGAGPDLLPRMIAQELSAEWAQQVVVDQRPGAGGIIAAETVSKATPDGYTMLLTTGAYTLHAVVMGARLPYKLERDLAPVTLVTVLPVIVVANPSLPVKTLAELIKLAKAKPGQINCAHAGTNTSSHFGCELLKASTGMDLLSVPFKGSAAATVATISGETHIQCTVMQGSLPLVKAGKLRPLAITGAKRSAQLPDIPTVTELGFASADYHSWNGVHVTAGTPKPVIAQINAAIVRALKQPHVQQRMQGLGLEVSGNTPEEFAAFVKADIARWARIAKQTGVRGD